MLGLESRALKFGLVSWVRVGCVLWTGPVRYEASTGIPDRVRLSLLLRDGSRCDGLHVGRDGRSIVP